MTVAILAAIFLVKFGSLAGAFECGLCKKAEQFEIGSARLWRRGNWPIFLKSLD